MIGRLLLGACLILWALPASAAISRPVACNSAETNTVTAPTHAVGDVLIVWTWRDADTTNITMPGTFTLIEGTTATSRALQSGYLVADTTSEVVGTWTSAEVIVACVFRGVDTADPIGTTNGNTNASSATMNYPAVTFEITDTSSWLLAAGGSRANTPAQFGDSPGALTQVGIGDTGGAGGMAVHSSEGGLTAWASTDVTVTTAAGYRTRLLELRAAAGAVSSTRRGTLVGVGP